MFFHVLQGEFNPLKTKCLHLKNNIMKSAYESHEKEYERVKEENEKLRNKLLKLQQESQANEETTTLNMSRLIKTSKPMEGEKCFFLFVIFHCYGLSSLSLQLINNKFDGFFYLEVQKALDAERRKNKKLFEVSKNNSLDYKFSTKSLNFLLSLKDISFRQKYCFAFLSKSVLAKKSSL